MSPATLLPGATIGILGGGQLGRMFVLEARRMGYRCVVLDPSPAAPAAQVADAHVVGALDDVAAVRELARRSDVVTLEWENVDLDAARAIEAIVPLRPGSAVLAVAQHRLKEKDAARAAGLATAGYVGVRSLAELRDGLARVGLPAVLKTCQGGYDGQGQARIRTGADAEPAWHELGGAVRELILEEWIPFRCEVSVVTARGAGGESAGFPVGENLHSEGILDTTIVPARIPAGLAAEAQRMAAAFAEHLAVVGLLAVEIFVDPDDRLLVNEIAPRPHNSGHYTWEACTVSQFEQHLRAVCGLPLDPAELLRPAAMVNLLGHEIGTGMDLASVAGALAVPGVALHLYGKAEARPRRKMGHLTALGSTADAACFAAREAKRALLAG